MVRWAKNGLMSFRFSGAASRCWIVCSTSGRPFSPATTMPQRICPASIIAQIFDLSNACLGFLNGLVTLGAMIDAGQIRCGMVVAGAFLSATQHSELCQGDTAGEGLSMQTDSEQLLLAGVEVAVETWKLFEQETGWTRATPQRFICHPVGSMHRPKLYETVRPDLGQ